MNVIDRGKNQSFSFKKKEHLLKKLDFDRVFSLPTKKYSSCFTVLFKRNNLHFSRIGLIVAKRNVSKANKRNTIKRIIRESFRINQVKQLCLDLIVICNKQVTMMDKQTIRAHIDSLWVKISE